MSEIEIKSTRNFIHKIETGDFTVIDSGIVIMADVWKGAKFYLDDLTVEIKYVNDDNDKKVRIYYDAPTENTIEIKCINFDDSSLGRGNPEPVSIINMGGETIYIRFIVFALSNLARIVYTFYKKTAI